MILLLSTSYSCLFVSLIVCLFDYLNKNDSVRVWLFVCLFVGAMASVADKALLAVREMTQPIEPPLPPLVDWTTTNSTAAERRPASNAPLAKRPKEAFEEYQSEVKREDKTCSYWNSESKRLVQEATRWKRAADSCRKEKVWQEAISLYIKSGLGYMEAGMAQEEELRLTEERQKRKALTNQLTNTYRSAAHFFEQCARMCLEAHSPSRAALWFVCLFVSFFACFVSLFV